MKIKYYKHILLTYDFDAKKETRVVINSFRKKPTLAQMRAVNAITCMSEEREIDVPTEEVLELIDRLENSLIYDTNIIDEFEKEN